MVDVISSEISLLEFFDKGGWFLLMSSLFWQRRLVTDFLVTKLKPLGVFSKHLYPFRCFDTFMVDV